MLTHYRRYLLLVAFLLLATLFVNFIWNETWKSPFKASTSHFSSPTPTPSSTPIPTSTSLPIITPSLVPTATPNILGAAYDSNMDLKAGPVSLPLQIHIPIFNVDAPILGVGLTEDNAMDAPKGPLGDPNWSSTFWYRGSAIPGEPGTTTIAGHVNGLLGQPETFAHIWKLQPGDEIIITTDNSSVSLTYIVDEVQVYSSEESSDPAIQARIYGSTASKNNLQPTPDGLSHLTLITCAGQYNEGEYDYHTIVFATLRR